MIGLDPSQYVRVRGYYVPPHIRRRPRRLPSLEIETEALRGSVRSIDLLLAAWRVRHP